MNDTYTLHPKTRQPVEKADVCIIGAGPAGALIAYSLSKRGFKTVILEAGPRFDPQKRIQQMEEGLRPEGAQREVWNMGGERDRYTSSGDLFYRLNNTRVKGVGGATLHWLGITPRLHRKDFEMNTRYGLARDWPYSYSTLRPYYAKAEEEMGVSGGMDNPFAPPREQEYPMDAFPPSYTDSLFAEACDRLGITVHSTPQARNSEGYDGRSRCLSFNTCIPVCPSGAKYSADVHVEKAEEQGTVVISRAPVQYIDHDEHGESVTAAVYATPDGERFRQTADVFILAAGGVETTRLLKLSTSEEYPDGLANSSGVLGHYFMEHPFIEVTGLAKEPVRVNPSKYPTTSSHQFYEHDNPTPGSVKMMFKADSTPVAQLALRGGDESGYEDLFDPIVGDLWGDDLLEMIRGTHATKRRRLTVEVVAEPLPDSNNTIDLDYNKTDNHGNPVPEINWNLGDHARSTLRKGQKIAEEILTEMGAEIIDSGNVSDPTASSHPMGTTRMGTDPDESLVDPTLKTHDLRNLYVVSSSVFPSAGAMNPTLTIAALALKTADHISQALE